MSQPDDRDHRELDAPHIFDVGDVITSPDGAWIGVVLAIDNSSDNDVPHWELHVDGAKDGVLQGVGIWPIDAAVPASDPSVVAEAARLALRGL